MLNRIVVLFALPALLSAYPSGARIPAGNAGEPGAGTPCASCHSVTLNPSGGSVQVSGTGAFTPGVAQRWTVTITDPNASYRKGFQLTATAGTFAAVSNTVVIASAGKQYVSQSAAATTFTLDWTPPSGTDSITVYVAGAAASGTRATNVYTASVKLAAAASTAVPTASAAVNAATYGAAISPGSWLTIFGSNLAPAGIARSWTAAELASGKLPTTLEGTSVKINGKPAAIAYISETQLNVQAPDDTATGSVAVDVTTSGGTAKSVAATLQPFAPGLFRFPASDSRYLAAFAADGSYLGPTGLLGAGVLTRPAITGETILFFGTGFGPTNPTVSAGSTFAGAAPLAAATALSVQIGGVAATVQFAGLVSPGLYQFNAVVPVLETGEYRVTSLVGGVSVPTTQYLAVVRK